MLTHIVKYGRLCEPAGCCLKLALAQTICGKYFSCSNHLSDLRTYPSIHGHWRFAQAARSARIR